MSKKKNKKSSYNSNKNNNNNNPNTKKPDTNQPDDKVEKAEIKQSEKGAQKASKAGKPRRKKPLWAKILCGVGIVIGALLLIVILFFGWMTAVEYRPDDVEKVDIDTVTGTGGPLTEGSQINIMTWNIGYGALGDNADFFMDGGESVMTATPERMDVNLAGLVGLMSSTDPDVLFLQEVDLNSKRSYNRDELTFIKGEMVRLSDFDWDNYLDNYTGEAAETEPETDEDNPGFNSTFAYNFKVKYVPYPVPDTIGQVEGGIATISKYEVSDAERISLPCPFSWPVRTANLKRCLLVDRVPVKDENGNDTGKELVLVNLHLEAYDDGEGKKAQTEQLRDFLQAEYDKGNYVIAGGDFNQSFSNIDTSMYPSQEGLWHCGQIDTSVFSDDWLFEMDNTTPTCRSLDKAYQGADKDSFQYYMIDGFIVSKNISVDSLQTMNYLFTATDHNPVLMTVTLGD